MKKKSYLHHFIQAIPISFCSRHIHILHRPYPYHGAGHNTHIILRRPCPDQFTQAIPISFSQAILISFHTDLTWAIYTKYTFIIYMYIDYTYTIYLTPYPHTIDISFYAVHTHIILPRSYPCRFTRNIPIWVYTNHAYAFLTKHHM